MSSLRKPPSLLNKQRIEGRLWLAADIHLGPHAPKTAAAFYDFLAQARTRADALILCGDIFEAWIGDDIIQTPPKWLKMAIQALQDCSQKTQLYLMQGNRDFLLRERFAQHVNAIWLPYEVIVKTHQTYFLLTHGDQYCTNDTHYLRYRRIVHQRW